MSGMPRTYVVTGSASGIGKATMAILEQQGGRVVGVDVRDAEIVADLGTQHGRSRLVDGVQAAFGDAVDAVIACAGVGGPTPEAIVRVNYFGAVATLSDLRPFLARGNSPRAAAVASTSMLHDFDETLLDACLVGDEEAAVGWCENAGSLVYATTKRGVARWVRRNAATSDWAGAGIALNGVAPGVIETPMTQWWINDPTLRAEMMERVPTPFGGIGKPEYVASLLAWLASPDNRFVTGQVVLIDGGYHAVTRGDDIW
jgi:NAD(P)-dependent dehydrogenase (short-subunit alcohol dehydrogenase family)